MDRLKETLKQMQVKKTKLIAESREQAISQLKAAVKTDIAVKEKIADVTIKRQRTSPVRQKSKLVEKAAAEPVLAKSAMEPVVVASAKSVIKLPFPVLNDKRNMKIILGTLESKRNELIKKRDQNLVHLKVLNKNKKMEVQEKENERIEKLKQLDQAFESHRDKVIIFC